MIIAGIIAEYNPFHSGHEYHIAKTRENGATHVIAVMSGNFVQRGETAVTDKRARAEAALNGGADLIVELPLPYAIASAEAFAAAGVRILNAFGCVDLLSFGCETDKLSQMQSIAQALLSEKFGKTLQKKLLAGISFPAAREQAIGALCGEDAAELLQTPNNTLAIEYFKALIQTDSSITPICTQRIGSAHDVHENTEILCASHIREYIKNGKLENALKALPNKTAEILKRQSMNGKISDFSLLESAMVSYLRRLSPEDFLRFADVSEGLENRLYSAVKESKSLSEITQSIKCKRYTHSRIRRILLNAFLDVPKELQKLPPPYLRILGFNARGLEILKTAKNTASLPIITKAADLKSAAEIQKIFFETESKSTDQYYLSCPARGGCAQELSAPIVKVL